MKAEYEPRVGSRFVVMLRHILKPGWPQSAKSKNFNFSEALRKWDCAIAEYEAQSNEIVSDNFRAAVLSEESPEEVRVVLRQAAHAVGDDYAKMRAFIKDYLISQMRFDGAGVVKAPGTKQVDDMEVDAAFARGIWQKGFPWKSGGKSYDGKGGKFGNGKGGRYDKGKGRESPSRQGM